MKIIFRINADRLNKRVLTSLSTCHQVTSTFDDRNGVLLNWCWILVVAFLDVFQQEIVQAWIFEWFAWFWCLITHRIVDLDWDVFELWEINTSRNTSVEELIFFQIFGNVKFLDRVLVELGVVVAASTFWFGLLALETFGAWRKVALATATRPITWSACTFTIWITVATTTATATFIAIERWLVIIGWCIFGIAFIGLALEARWLWAKYLYTALAADPIRCTTATERRRCVSIISWCIFRISLVRLTLKTSCLRTKNFDSACTADPIAGTFWSITSTWWCVFCIAFWFTATETAIFWTENDFWTTITNPIGFSITTIATIWLNSQEKENTQINIWIQFYEKLQFIYRFRMNGSLNRCWNCPNLKMYDKRQCLISSI